MKSDLFIFAGEQSGDLYGEQLITALLEKNPALKIVGVGGPKMRSISNFECVFPMEKFHVMGFIAVLFALPRLIRQFYLIKKLIRQSNAKKVLFIDYPDFNLRLAKSLKKSGFKGKIAHYICPSIWAWRKNRTLLMEKVLDTLFCILPFEKNYFKDSLLTVKYVGHPLIKRIEEHVYAPLSFPEGKKIIGIFPGSRQKEIDLNFPFQLELMKKLSQEYTDLHFVVSVAHSKFFPLIEDLVQKKGLAVQVIDQNKNYNLMRSCYLAIAKSGTITLELALHQIPTVVIYGISPVDLFIARSLLNIKLPFYALPNIIYQASLFPELFGPRLTNESLYNSVKNFLLNENSRNECRLKCDQLYNLLKNKDPDGDIVSELIT